MFPALAVSALLAWSLLAFGGVYPWAALPTAIGAALLALVEPPRFGGSPALRRLDVCLFLVLGAAALQLVPLPTAILAGLSPQRASFEAAYRVDAGLAASSTAPAPASLSLAPAATAYVLVLTAAVLLLFWTCRTLLASGGARRVTRAVSWLGLLAALVAIVQRAVSPAEIYGFWRPLEPGAQPLGPIVNRNQLATWMLMALPLTVGYLAAHAQSHRPDRPQPFSLLRLLRAADARVLWLAAAAALMLLVLVVSTSRAALLSVAVSVVFGAWMGRQRAVSGGRWALLGCGILALAVLLAWANFGAVVLRLDDLATGGPGGRTLIWRDTLTMVRDFWLTGVGLGSYQTAMTVYQTSMRGVFFNHAHNQYLQLAAEGGLLLVVPAGLAAIAFAHAAIQRVRTDLSPIGSLRVGALAGLVAVAVQSVWECGLNAPANGVLLAVAAAVVLHCKGPDEEARG